MQTNTQEQPNGGSTTLLTGATGFIGRHLAADLRRRGCAVRALVRPGSDSSQLEALGVEIAVGDLQHATSLVPAVDGCEVVFHLATHRSDGVARLPAYNAVNVEGTRNLLAAAARAGVERLVYASTIAVYGRLGRIAANEVTPPEPILYHGISKRSAELLVERCRADGKLSTTVARLPWVMGPEQLRHFAVFREVVAKRGFVMLGSGETSCNVVDVIDAVDGLRRCASRGSGCYLITGWNTTLNELVRTIAEEADVPHRVIRLPLFPAAAGVALLRPISHAMGYEPWVVKAVDFYARERRFDGSKARRELGFAPRVPLRESVRRTLEWYRNTGRL